MTQLREDRIEFLSFRTEEEQKMLWNWSINRCGFMCIVQDVVEDVFRKTPFEKEG